MRWDAIIKRLDKNAPLIGAEVGVWEGLNSLKLLEAMPNIVMHYMIDPYEPYEDRFYGGKRTPFGGLVASQANLNGAKEKAREITEPYKDRRVLVYKSSIVASLEIADKSLDYVFIDAAHDYESARVDILTWLEKIKPGGLISGHNYKDGTYKGVDMAVEEIFGQVEADSNVTWFKRVE